MPRPRWLPPVEVCVGLLLLADVVFACLPDNDARIANIVSSVVLLGQMLTWEAMLR